MQDINIGKHPCCLRFPDGSVFLSPGGGFCNFALSFLGFPNITRTGRAFVKSEEIIENTPCHTCPIHIGVLQGQVYNFSSYNHFLIEYIRSSRSM